LRIVVRKLRPKLIHQIDSRSIPSVLLASPGYDDHKEFKKPNNVQPGSKELSADLPSHYTPSPLAVPSPNW
jgi:hypothetical protein